MARATKQAQSDDVEFVKQVPVYPKHRLATATKRGIELFKQIPLHLRDRLRRKRKILKHQKNRTNKTKLKVAKDNISALMQGKLVFDPERFFFSNMLSDTSKVDEEQIIDRILEKTPSDNDNIYLVHKPGTNAFSKRRKDGT